ncbi:MAG: helix-turn-helix domain-containing protein [Patescibacteria group bacterium]|nr:helix-turn-helix domain-containing protein [Patescibacteria group bacterium]
MDKRRYRELERMLKGAANHRRVEVMDMLDKNPELSVSEITDRLMIDFRTASEHLRKLLIAGLVMKRYEGTTVRHALTARGRSILQFCRILE